MRASPKPWPNGLGYDVGRVAVFTGNGNEEDLWRVTFPNGKSAVVPAACRVEGWKQSETAITEAVSKARKLLK